jgi:hypothetical protein
MYLTATILIKACCDATFICNNSIEQKKERLYGS